ncbi:MAG: tryptophan--tRNA ligase [Clostridia bacterium]|nr:tryptophan--tRNA ligase [Clostridia bacterium]MBR4261685.1 tryptophan--tRNA ligase [Clostridia bacterium]
MEKKVILSGIQATGDLHLGHYIGVLKRFNQMQEDYNCYYMIANLHALTVRRDPKELKENAYKLLASYIAAGLDPDKSTIFLQSQVHEHAELAWVLDCYTYMGELSRMTQFKDKSAKHADNINAGLFTYPSLMAGDILLYQADLVPTGEDQKQHVELTRDLAERFNKLYGDTFKVPEPYIEKVGARIMGLQDPTSKMSKSSTLPNDTILLIDTPEDIMKKVKKAVTDSEGIVKYDEKNKPGISNLMEIYGIITNKSMEEIEKEFDGQGYGTFKVAVAEAIIKELEPFRNKYNELMANPKLLEEIYNKGAKKASEVASKTLKDVYDKIGIIR